jgi:hypothetical protein
LDPLLPSEIGLDNAAAVPLLKEIANKVDLTDTIAWLQNVWKSEQNGTDKTDEEKEIDNNGVSAWRCAIM